MPASPTIRALCLALLASSTVACDDDEAAAKADAKTIEAAEQQWSALRGCLVGAPLAEGEKASERMQKSELTLVARGLEKVAWPSSCVKAASDLAATLEGLKVKATVSRYAKLNKTLAELADTGPTMMTATDSPVVDRVFTAAADVGLRAAPGSSSVSSPASSPAAATGTATATTASPPTATAAPTAAAGAAVAPAPSEPLPVAELAELGVSKGFIERVEQAPSETVRFMLGDSEAGAFYCAIGSAKAPLDHARCAAIAGEVNVAAAPLSAESPEADYFWNAEPNPVVRQVGGQTYDVAVEQTAFVFDNGTIGDVVPTRLKPELVRRLASGRKERAPLKPPGGGGLLGHRGGVLVWRGPLRGASGRRPFIVQHVQDGRSPLSGRVETGEIPKHSEHLAACRSGDQFHLLVVDRDPKAADMVESKRDIAIVRRDGKRWKSPIRASIDVGAGATRWWDRGIRSFTCQGAAATLTWMREDRRVGQLRCAGEECTGAMSEPLPAASNNEKLRVSNIGDRALVVRTIRAMGPLAGLTELVAMRLAPVAELASAPERVLLGDDKHGGLPDLHKSLGLVSTGAAAVVLIHSGPKVYGLRIDGQGRPTKLRLDKDGT